MSEEDSKPVKDKPKKESKLLDKPVQKDQHDSDQLGKNPFVDSDKDDLCRAGSKQEVIHNVYEVNNKGSLTEDGTIDNKLFSERKSVVREHMINMTEHEEPDEFEFGHGPIGETKIRVSMASGAHAEVMPETTDEQEQEEGPQSRRPSQEYDPSKQRHSVLLQSFIGGQSLPTSNRRSTLYSENVVYDSEPRFRSSSVASDDFLQPTPSTPFQFLATEEEEEAQEEEEEEAEAEQFDRKPFIQRFEYLSEIMNVKLAKNRILNSLIDRVFTRKNLKSSAFKYDNIYTEKTYTDKLNAYDTLLKVSFTQRAQKNRTIEEHKVHHTRKAANVFKLFTALQEREEKIGYGLTYSKTGAEIPEKLVARLIRQQKFYFDEICSMRSTFVRLKDRVEEKLADIQKLEYKGSGLHLVDFEQLKLKNRTYSDKMEEKESELAKLRTVCALNIQTLAHLREKLAALEMDVEEAETDLGYVCDDFVEQRKTFNSLRRGRDFYRNQTYKLKEETGLLLQPSLLIDMEHSIEECRNCVTELADLKEQSAIKSKQIRNLRSLIEHYSEQKKKKGVKKSARSKKSATRSIYRKLTDKAEDFPVPTIESKAFIHLGKIVTGKCFKDKKIFLKNKSLKK